MGFLDLFEKKEKINSYGDFWQWFIKNEKQLAQVVKTNDNVEKKFISKLTRQLNQLRDGFNFLAGMMDEDTVELVITPDGIIKNVVFVEELVEAAPAIPGWKFTALKPPVPEGMNIRMEDYDFSENNIHFVANEHSERPDEIDLTFFHDQFTDENSKIITSGVFIYLDNFLGEESFITSIDNVTVARRPDIKADLISIAKLPDYLKWRTNEFIEKYDGTRYDTQNDQFSILQAQLKNGRPLIALINSELLRWDRKASHPWIATMSIKYRNGINGLPDEQASVYLSEIDEKFSAELLDENGYLNIGRQTADNSREIYFACKEFRNVSKVMDRIQNHYKDRLEIEYDIYKDKYWRSLDHFIR